MTRGPSWCPATFGLEIVWSRLPLRSGAAGRGDTIVFLGDYIDRGPDSRACIDATLDFRGRSAARVVCLRGNHEDWLLRLI
jgi:serine/threonine protein phosphatase 1